MLEFCILLMILEGDTLQVGWTRQEIKDNFTERLRNTVTITDQELGDKLLSFVEQDFLVCSGGRYKLTEYGRKFLENLEMFKFVKTYMR